MQSVKDSSS